MTILTLDGGGTRGFYSLRLAMHLEETMGGPLNSKFDIFCGTSVGSIIATFFAAGHSASDTNAIMLNIFNTILPSENKGKYYGVITKNVMNFLSSGYKFKQETLLEALRPYFGDSTMADFPKLHICSFDTVQSTTKFFNSSTPTVKVLDAILASSAAPVFLPPKRISTQQGTDTFLDGGLISNNPTLFLLQNLLSTTTKHDKNYKVLSISTHNQLAGKPLINTLNRWNLINNVHFLLDYFLVLQSIYPDTILADSKILDADITYMRVPGSMAEIPYQYSIPMDRINKEDLGIMTADADKVFKQYRQQLHDFLR